MKNGVAILIGVVIGLLSGVGYAQYTVVGRVENHETRMARVEKDVSEVAALVRTSLELNKEFIAVLKLQNELLMRQRNQ